MAKTNFKNIDDYIATFPEEMQERMQELRKTIHKAAPGATESISYQMPAFNSHGYLVYFGGWQNHIGLYPMPSGMKEFSKELAVYASGKGSVQFPNNKALPLALITKIVKFRLKENLEKEASKGKTKSARPKKKAIAGK
jgi:uncharacterized protein YdhG (YjbR/CyaY superfamily)